MSDLCVLIDTRLDEKLHGSFTNYSISSPSQNLLVTLEDYFFDVSGKNIVLSRDNTTAITIRNAGTNADEIDNRKSVIEFSLALLLQTGHLGISTAAILNNDTCKFAKQYQNIYASDGVSNCEFSQQLDGHTIAQWLSICFRAYKTVGNRLHVTADRYTRYSRAKTDPETLLDLCICLESLLESQTEISFRFMACLTKITGLKGADAYRLADILSELYNVRSKLVHGDPQGLKLARKLQSNSDELNSIARRILVKYIIFTSEKSSKEWKEHLKASIFD